MWYIPFGERISRGISFKGLVFRNGFPNVVVLYLRLACHVDRQLKDSLRGTNNTISTKEVFTEVS